MAQRSITLDITTYNLGDNTAEDNDAYRLAVEEELEARFPGAAVEVNLISGTDRDRARASWFEDDDETESAALLVAQDVWNEASW